MYPGRLTKPMPIRTPLHVLPSSSQPTSSEPLLRAGGAGARSLYVHVPFCTHKCHYCDFYSFVDTQDRQPAYADALTLELRALAHHAACDGRPRLDTIFVGGGTPSLLQPDLWRRMLDTLHESFEIDPAAEFTVECNPETVTADLMRILAAGGVNRVSIGAQSFEQRHLRMLERRHDPANVGRALAIAHDAGIARRNIDLIFGVPGQTLDEWLRDIDAALTLRPAVEHLSCYALTYEPGTAMTARLARGEFPRMNEEEETILFRRTLDTLRAASFERYEVSNFARKGAECRHNLAYWRQQHWLAAGPSASAHLGGARWKNTPRLSDWMDHVTRTRGYSPVIDVESPDPRRALQEHLMTGLRLAEGIPTKNIEDAAHRLELMPRLTRAFRKYESTGHIGEHQGCWRLTDEGFLLADMIAAEMIAACGA